MTDTKADIIKQAAIIRWRTDLAGKTVKQIDAMCSPTGNQNHNAFMFIRLERLNEERHAERVTKLRTMLDITDEQLELLEVKGEANNGCGLVLALKTDREAEEEAARLEATDG